MGESELSNKLAAVAWGLFFVWIGIAVLADVGIGAGMLGVGIITLGAQIARRQFNLGIEGFWVVVGLLFLVGGLWNLFEAQLPLLPIVLIAAGILLLISAVRRKHPAKE